MNNEMEQRYLGSLLISLQRGKAIETKLTAEDFSDRQYRRIFATILKQSTDKNIAIPDIATLVNELKDINAGTIVELTNTLSDANIAYFEEQILEASKKRLFINKASQAAEKAKNNNADIDETIKEFTNELTKTITTPTDRNRYSTWEGYCQVCTNYDPSKDFKIFNTVQCPDGTLSYIGARPGGGKTTMMVNIAREAITQGRRAFFVNLEMSNKQILTNLILSMMYAKHGSSLNNIVNPLATYYGLFKERVTATADFVQARQEAMDIMSGIIGKSLFIYDGIGNDIDRITMSIQAHTKPGDIVLVDYVQRLQVKANNQRYLEIKAASNALMQLAIQNNLVVIAGAQLSRKAEEGEATLADFREGGDIEADGHNAIAIEQKKDESYMYVLKAREGKSGHRIILLWKREYCYMSQEEQTDNHEKSISSISSTNKNKNNSSGKKPMTPEERYEAFKKGE